MLGSWVNKEKTEITLILTNFPCSYNKCYHCAFDIESINDKEEISSTNKGIIEEARVKIEEYNIKKIKIFNGGSFFELPAQVFQDLKQITKNKELSLESRPEFLSKKTITHLFEKLKPSKLNIYVGFDSADEKIRNTILNKGISQNEIDRIINISKNTRAFFFSYIIFGIEGISEDLIKDSVLFFKKNLSGVSAIQFRENLKSKLKTHKISEDLRKFLIENCENVDFIGDDDEQWLLSGSSQLEN
ncbi:MAG: hypothetical protein ACTSRG_03205 [Candidatus Helarchaeota archaeon]